MHFSARRDQFSYFLGFVARTRGRALREAVDLLAENGHLNLFPEAVFEFCPFNDGQEQIFRAYMIYENGKRSDFVPRIIELIEQYIFLVSDFEPPCCGDGRAFYERTSRGEIVLGCDRCGASYLLDGSPMTTDLHKKMAKAEFVELFGEGTASDWPFHSKLQKLLAKSLDFPPHSPS
jgi:hypothetical protein